MPYTVGIVTLGCKVNQYESEAIAEGFFADGMTVADASLPCDVYVINTCTVTAESDRKSKQMIRRAKAQNPNAVIIVTGCLSQVSPETVAATGADFICGSRNKLRVISAAKEILNGELTGLPRIELEDNETVGFEPMRISRFPRTRAYIKIEDGCESHCSYCIIPQARGKICSKPPQEILKEIEGLIDDGCPEVVLTGIETASYGIDLVNYRLAELLTDIDRIADGKIRVRLGSLDPSLIRPGFVERISALHSTAPHFHLSVQSGCNATLAKMKRKYNKETVLSGISLLRDAIPNVQFTSDFITAFPGETDNDFLETAELIKEVGFLNSHIFTYSRRGGTPAALMPGRPSAKVGKDRTNQLIAVQKSVTERVLSSELGNEYPVLFETDSNGFSTGHTPSFIEVKVASSVPLHSKTRLVRLTDIENGIAIGVPTTNN